MLKEGEDGEEGEREELHRFFVETGEGDRGSH